MIHHAFRSSPQFYRTPLWAVSHVAIINPLCPWDSWLFEVVLQAEFGPIYLKGIGGMQHVVDPMPNFMMGWNWLRGTLTLPWTCTYDWWKSKTCCVLLKEKLAWKTTFVDEWHRQFGTMKSPRNVDVGSHWFPNSARQNTRLTQNNQVVFTAPTVHRMSFHPLAAVGVGRWSHCLQGFILYMF